MLSLPALSNEYVRVPISATSSGVAVDPTADTVQMAFVALGTQPASGDWKAAGWETDSTTSPATYYARCLVGPSGTVTLAAGDWGVWVKVTDSPEIPVRQAGVLRIT